MGSGDALPLNSDGVVTLHEISYSIRQRRAALGMSQKVFADHVGVRAYVIAELEVCRYPRASPKRLEKLATFLGVSVDQLNPQARDVAKGQKGGRWPKPKPSTQHSDEVDAEIDLYDRPVVRGDCLTSVQRYHNLHATSGARGERIDPPDEFGGDGAPDGINCQRPCPFVSCKHHLFVDLNQRSGGMKLNFPEFDVWQLASMSAAALVELDDETLRVMESENPGSTFPSCSLDVSDVLGITLERVGVYLNVTRERARQLETLAQHKYKVGIVEVALHVDDVFSGGDELRDLIDSQVRDEVGEAGFDYKSEYVTYSSELTSNQMRPGMPTY